MQRFLLFSYFLTCLFLVEISIGEYDLSGATRASNFDNNTVSTISTKADSESDGLPSSTAAIDSATGRQDRISIHAGRNKSAYNNALVLDVPGQNRSATILLDAAHMNMSFVNETVNQLLYGIQSRPTPKQSFEPRGAVQGAIEMQTIQKGSRDRIEEAKCQNAAANMAARPSPFLRPSTSDRIKGPPLERRGKKQTTTPAAKIPPDNEPAVNLLDFGGEESCLASYRGNDNVTKELYELADQFEQLLEQSQLRQSAEKRLRRVIPELKELEEMIRRREALIEKLATMPSLTTSPTKSAITGQGTSLRPREYDLPSHPAELTQQGEGDVWQKSLVVAVLYGAGTLLLGSIPLIGQVLNWPADVLAVLIFLEILFQILHLIYLQQTNQFLEERVRSGSSPTQAFEALGLEIWTAASRKFAAALRRMAGGPPRRVHVNELGLATMQQINGAFHDPTRAVSAGVTIMDAWDEAVGGENRTV